MRRRLIRLGIAFCLATAAMPAAAQALYTINGRPPPYDVVRYMATHGLPPGDYWLDAYGNWGAVGIAQPLGNIYQDATPQRRPSLSERGMLYRPGEILGSR